MPRGTLRGTVIGSTSALALLACGRLIGIGEHVLVEDAGLVLDAAGADDVPRPQDDGASDAQGDASACPNNLVENSSFETSLQGWGAANGTIERVADGHEGGWAAHVCLATPSQTTYYSLQSDRAFAVASAGTTFHLRLWVRSSLSPQELDAVIRARTLDGGVESGDDREIVSSTWQTMSAAFRPSTSGGSIDLYVAGTDRVAGACFDVDDVCLTAE